MCFDEKAFRNKFRRTNNNQNEICMKVKSRAENECLPAFDANNFACELVNTNRTHGQIHENNEIEARDLRSNRLHLCAMKVDIEMDAKVPVAMTTNDCMAED